MFAHHERMLVFYAWKSGIPGHLGGSRQEASTVRFRRQDHSYHLQILSLQAHGQVTKSLSEILKSSEIKFFKLSVRKIGVLEFSS